MMKIYERIPNLILNIKKKMEDFIRIVSITPTIEHARSSLWLKEEAQLLECSSLALPPLIDFPLSLQESGYLYPRIWWHFCLLALYLVGSLHVLHLVGTIWNGLPFLICNRHNLIVLINRFTVPLRMSNSLFLFPDA